MVINRPLFSYFYSCIKTDNNTETVQNEGPNAVLYLVIISLNHKGRLGLLEFVAPKYLAIR